ncbi:MAG TPA: sulfotransferase [Chitinophagaceae bacterium]|jgi:hypothetical protein
MQNLPDFLVVGPPKTASTSLHYYLSQHPEVFMSPKKETRFFDVHYEKGLDYYSEFFKDRKNQKMTGEASPTYAFLPFVAGRIKNNLPDAKIIFCFRDPVERAFSGWLMRGSKGNETLSFRQALEKNLEQREHINFNDEEGARIWLDDQQTLYKKNKLTIRTYIEGSMYAEQLKSYRKYFADEKIKVLLLDDLKNDFRGALLSIFEFLNVDSTVTAGIRNETKNQHNKNMLKPLFNLVGKEVVFKAGKIIPKGMRNKLFEFAVKGKQEKPKINEADRSFAYNIFRNDVEELEKLLAKDLSAWKNF